MIDIPGRIYFKNDEVYSDWFNRGGDGLILRAEVIDAKNTSVQLKLEVYTKSAETTGRGSSAGTGWDITLSSATADLGKVQELIKLSTATAGLNEMVRYRITGINGSDGDWIHARIFPPIFFDAAT